MYPDEALFQFPFVKGHAEMSAHDICRYQQHCTAHKKQVF